jgi:hypothetical protein
MNRVGFNILGRKNFAQAISHVKLETNTERFVGGGAICLHLGDVVSAGVRI